MGFAQVEGRRKLMAFRALLLAALPLSLVACGPVSKEAAAIHDTMPYRPSKGFWTLDIDNSGYTEKQVANATWQVDVVSNTVTSPARVEAVALLRSAELGRQNGFSHFKITEKKASLRCNALQSGGVTGTPIGGSAIIAVTAQYAKTPEQGFDSVDGYIAANATSVKSYSSTAADREATHAQLRAACIVMQKQR